MNKAYKLSEDNLEDIVNKYYNLKLSLIDIGKFYNVSYCTILRFLDRFGYRRRTRQEGLNTEKCKDKIKSTTILRWTNVEYKENQISKRINKPSGAKDKTWKIINTTNYIRYGSRNSNWKNGRTKLQRLIRSSVKHCTWRNDIFIRDNYTCQHCHKTSNDVDIQAHHIIPVSYIILHNNISNLEDAINCVELWDITNGITLCIECHKNTATYGKGINGYSGVNNNG